MICIYCNGQHWSDECQTFPTVTARKEKIKGHCFICLKQGHQQKNCTVKKTCVYCKQRSLCIKKFPVEKSSEMAHSVTEPLSATVATEHTLLSSDEQVLMQTATVEVFNPEKFSHLLKDIPLADSVPSTTETAKIELLLGNDYYCDIFSGDIAMKAVSPGLNFIEIQVGMDPNRQSEMS